MRYTDNPQKLHSLFVQKSAKFLALIEKKEERYEKEMQKGGKWVVYLKEELDLLKRQYELTEEIIMEMGMEIMKMQAKAETLKVIRQFKREQLNGAFCELQKQSPELFERAIDKSIKLYGDKYTRGII